MVYCPRCQKLVNTNAQVIHFQSQMLSVGSIICEECNTTISNKIADNPKGGFYEEKI